MHRKPNTSGMGRGVREMQERIHVEGPRSRPVDLVADLTLPDHPHGMVLFAHGSGSSRLSPRNRSVARHLTVRGLATTLLDLLSAEEERVDARTAESRFDIPLLGDRLVQAVDWLDDRNYTLPLGLFGASTGAAGAMVAAAERPRQVAAVVSRGGRPDLAEQWLPAVTAPTLLIVGQRDPDVLELNRRAMRMLTSAVNRLSTVEGATHLFEEPGALDRVAELAADWFDDHLGGAGR